MRQALPHAPVRAMPPVTRRIRPLAALLLLLSVDAPALAQDGPGAAPILACTAAIEGAVSCMAEKLCLCRFDPGGTLTGRPPRHRWDCGINRPSCGTVPADIPGGYGAAGPLPIAPIQPQVLIPYGGPPHLGGGPGAWR